MSNKIQRISQIDRHYMPPPPVLKTEEKKFSTVFQVDGVEYKVSSEKLEDLDKLISDKKNEIITVKRDERYQKY